MLRRIVTLGLLALPLEAHTSGSSTVQAEGAHLTVSLESGRKIFDGGDGEADWHAEWVREHQAEVDAAVPRLEAALLAAASKESVALAPFAAALPEAWAYAPPDHELSPRTVCVSGCRVRLQLWTSGVTGAPAMEVVIALAAAPPDDDALPRISKALAQALVEPATP